MFSDEKVALELSLPVLCSPFLHSGLDVFAMVIFIKQN